MDTLEVIYTRRSVRRICRKFNVWELVTELLKAAVHASPAVNANLCLHCY
jgi:hypothetical protein